MGDALTITLTDRPPVTIVKDDWPIIANAESHDGGGHASQANRRWKIMVRQHVDGRTIVYAIYTSKFQGEPDQRAGRLLDVECKEDTIVAAIHEVADYLGFERALADRCIADLPAEELR